MRDKLGDADLDLVCEQVRLGCAAVVGDDAQGDPVRVTARGMFSADPVRLAADGKGGRLQWWAGPWPVDERWWDPDGSGRAGRTARVQVLLDGDTSQALLLCYRQRRWYVEGSYE